MVKIDGTITLYVDNGVNFMASTQAYMEYLGKCTRSDRVPENIPEDKIAFYLERLAWYRALYRPVCDKG